MAIAVMMSKVIQRMIKKREAAKAAEAQAKAQAAANKPEAIAAKVGVPASSNATQTHSERPQRQPLRMGMSSEEFMAANAQAKEQMAARRQARRAQFDAAMNAGSQKTLAQLDEERAAQLAAFNPNYTPR